MARYAARALRDFLLHGAVRDESVYLVSHPLAETRRHETLCYRGAHGHRVALPQRSRSILHAVRRIGLGVARGDAAPLTERLEIVHRIEARQHQHRIEHRRHVARVEEKSVAERIRRILRIVTQKLRIKQINEIGAAHSSARVSRLGLFDHRGGQDADIVGRLIKFRVSKHIYILFNSCYKSRISEVSAIGMRIRGIRTLDRVYKCNTKKLNRPASAPKNSPPRFSFSHRGALL